MPSRAGGEEVGALPGVGEIAATYLYGFFQNKPRFRAGFGVSFCLSKILFEYVLTISKVCVPLNHWNGKEARPQPTTTMKTYIITNAEFNALGKQGLPATLEEVTFEQLVNRLADIQAGAEDAPVVELTLSDKASAGLQYSESRQQLERVYAPGVVYVDYGSIITAAVEKEAFLSFQAKLQPGATTLDVA